MNTNRRTFLRAAGVSLALPLLDAFTPKPARGEGPAGPPRRMVCICTPLGLHPAYFFPENGREGLRADAVPGTSSRTSATTSRSSPGLSHPDVGPSHDSIFSFLTAAPHPERRAGFRNSISLDQFAAEHIGGQTRFPSLPLSCEGFGLSWTRSGALVPSDSWPVERVRQAVPRRPAGRSAGPGPPAAGRPEHSRRRAASRRRACSRGSARATARSSTSTSPASANWSSGWRCREEWSKKPKPKVDAKPPQNVNNPADLVGKTRLLFDLIHLALQTDSTRLVTLLAPGHQQRAADAGRVAGASRPVAPRPGSRQDRAAQTGRNREDEDVPRLPGEAEGDEGRRPTCSTARSSSSAATWATPARTAPRTCRSCWPAAASSTASTWRSTRKSPPPLSNLYVSMLQRLGIEADKFGSSTGTLTGLEMVG